MNIFLIWGKGQAHTMMSWVQPYIHLISESRKPENTYIGYTTITILGGRHFMISTRITIAR